VYLFCNPRALRRTLLAAAVAAVASPAQAQQQAAPPPAVGVVKAERKPLVTSFDFVGRIEAIGKVDLRARVTGFLEVRKFDEGSEVSENDLLFQIEKEQFQAEVERARAEIARAEATNENNKIQLGRAEQLLKTQAGTQARVDDAQAAERQSTAQIQIAQAALKQAEINLSYTEIKAPIAGKIGRSTYTVGNVVGPDSGILATIVSQDPMRVAFPISIREAFTIRDRLGPGAGAGVGAESLRVKVSLPDGSEYPHPGKIDFVDNQVDRNMDSVLVRATLPNPALKRGNENVRALIDGTVVTVRLEGAEPKMAVTIPRAALLADQQGPYVFIVDKEGRGQVKRVKLGQGTADIVSIESGLEEGDTVILEGIQRVRPGQPVTATPVTPAVSPQRMPGK
jgi:membrane fusion protein (multidrug efflux system)